MRRTTVVASTIGVLAGLGACALPAPGRYEMTPSRAFQTMSRQERDSVEAQAVADREGPRVTVRTELTSLSGSRRARAAFRVDDDAYVVIGQIGPDGVVRIVFPTDPRDDGFVKGNHSYQTPEFFAGFTDEFAYRARTSPYRLSAAAVDSYDGGLGYVFAIASWRPMHAEQFSTYDRWDTFELTDLDYMRDPRPAVHELASLLVGDQPEAYTVKFASYINTQVLYAGYGGLDFGSELGYCNGFSSYSWLAGSRPFGYYYGGYSRYNRGYYGYGAYNDCYDGYGFGGYRYGYPTIQIAQTPVPTQPTYPRAFNPGVKHSPPVPHDPVGRTPVRIKPPADVGTGTHFSTEYRLRGLITEDGPRTPPTRGRPGVELRHAGEPSSPSRPTIQQMVERHATDSHEGWSSNSNGRTRAYNNGAASDGSMRQGVNPPPRTPASEPRYTPSSGTRGYSSPGDHGATSGTRYRPPSSAGVERSAPVSAPSAPVSAPAAHSAPSAPSSPPPSAGTSSSGAGTPIKP